MKLRNESARFVIENNTVDHTVIEMATVGNTSLINAQREKPGTLPPASLSADNRDSPGEHCTLFQAHEFWEYRNDNVHDGAARHHNDIHAGHPLFGCKPPKWGSGFVEMLRQIATICWPNFFCKF